MKIEDASTIIVNFIQNPDYGELGSYGYDVYLPNLVRLYLMRSQKVEHHEARRLLPEYMLFFYSAAWDLCRRGIIRPGVNEYGAQSTPDGAAGNGYSITPFGKSWLQEVDLDMFVPTEPGRFSEMIAPYKQRFGPGFHQRAQESIKCYGAHAYLSCCVMCGAAAESIILVAAIEKDNEEEILKQYQRAQGRAQIEKILLAESNNYIQREFKGYMSLLKYWRDISAHGMKVDISESESFTSIALLLRFAQFMDTNWDSMTTKRI